MSPFHDFTNLHHKNNVKTKNDQLIPKQKHNEENSFSLTVNFWSKISTSILIGHIIVVCFLSAWSYCDVYNLSTGIYFKLSYLLGLSKVTGNTLEYFIYFDSMFYFPIVALFIATKRLQIKNSKERVFCHLLLSIFQFFISISLIS